MKVKEITQNYVEKYNACEQKRGEYENKIKRLKIKLEKLGYVSWINEIIKPIAKLLNEKMPDRYFDILGPFGLSCETSIHFYKNGIEEKELFTGDNCKSIHFRPSNLDNGEIRIVDYTKNTNKYAPGTIGEMNRFNYSTIPVPETIDELFEWVK